jgi:hypothetical protein
LAQDRQGNRNRFHFGHSAFGFDDVATHLGDLAGKLSDVALQRESGYPNHSVDARRTLLGRLGNAGFLCRMRYHLTQLRRRYQNYWHGPPA